LNENTNGLLRRFFPKGTDFSLISREEVAMAVEKINNLLRRSLQYRTAKEVFLSEIKEYAFQS
jgi:IS30 family transposase